MEENDVLCTFDSGIDLRFSGALGDHLLLLTPHMKDSSVLPEGEVHGGVGFGVGVSKKSRIGEG